MLTRLSLIAGLLFLTSFETPPAPAEEVRGRLVLVESGDLPIILTAPHGGREAIPGVPGRKGVGVELFNPRSDAFTDELTEKLAQAIEEQTGRRPYTVIAQFHRMYLDANRPPPLAYESDNAKATYDAYHDAIAQARRQVVERWGSGLLLDIHGQGEQSQVIFIGTQNGETTEHIRSQFGAAALTGEAGIFGQLTRQGFSLFPPIDSNELEHADYDGGHTVITYGSRSGGAVDAIQLELGLALRSRDANDGVAEKFATAIAAYRMSFLPAHERSPRARVGVYVDVGAGPSVNDLLADLARCENVSIQKLTADDIHSGRWLTWTSSFTREAAAASRDVTWAKKDGQRCVCSSRMAAASLGSVLAPTSRQRTMIGRSISSTPEWSTVSTGIAAEEPSIWRSQKPGEICCSSKSRLCQSTTPKGPCWLRRTGPRSTTTSASPRSKRKLL